MFTRSKTYIKLRELPLALENISRICELENLNTSTVYWEYVVVLIGLNVHYIFTQFNQ